MMDSWQQIPLEQIQPGSNYRRTFKGITDLAKSIREHGLLQNLVVLPKDDGTFAILAGERRYRALLMLADAGIWKDPVPCLVRTDSSLQLETIVENVQRHEAVPWQLGHRFVELIEGGLTQAQIAASIAKSEGFVSTCVQMARGLAPATVRALEKVGANTLSRTQLLRISHLVNLKTGEPDEAWQLKVLEKYLSNQPKGKMKGRAKPLRALVYERYRWLRKRAEPGPLGDTIETICDFLDGTTRRLELESVRHVPRVKTNRQAI